LGAPPNPGDPPPPPPRGGRAPPAVAPNKKKVHSEVLCCDGLAKLMNRWTKRIKFRAITL
jgi:hypothetical protein